MDVASLAVTFRTRHTQIDHLEGDTEGMITKNSNKKSHLHPDTRPTHPHPQDYSLFVILLFSIESYRTVIVG